MELEMIFAVLGIEETKDKGQIQNAYRAKLAENNPEDHPEEFMRLRQAYEQALAYADSIEEENAEEEDDSQVGMWMTNVKNVYNSIRKRIDEKEWKKLLEEDVCDDLEFCEDAKIRLFQFLMDNYRLPCNIYKLLDEKFGIEENQDAMKEFLPVDFVDYIIRVVHTDGEYDFAYEYLEGPDGAKFDFFIQSIAELEYAVEEDVSRAQELLDAMKATGITHPYLDAYETVILAKSGFEEDALFMARELIDKNAGSKRTCLIAAEAIYLAGEKEEAVDNFNNLTEPGQECFISEKYLAMYELECKNFEEAVTHCKNAMALQNDETISNLSEEIDRQYLIYMNDNIENGQVSSEELGEVIKALLRTGHEKEALKYINDYPDALTDIEYGESYRIDILSCAGEYDSAISHGEEYIDKILSEKCDDIEWKNAYMRTCYYTGKSYQRKAFELKEIKSRKFTDQLREVVSKTEDGLIPHHMIQGKTQVEPENGWKFISTVEDKDEYLARREEYCTLFDKSIEWYEKMQAEDPDDTAPRIESILSELGAGKYKSVIEKSVKYLEERPDDFIVMTYLQQAYYESGESGEVLELYNSCRAIYPGYYRIYEYAARLFIDYNQYEDAMNIIEIARESGADNDIFEVLEYRIKVLRCQSEGEYDEKHNIGDNLLSVMKKMLDKNDYSYSEILSELFYVMAVYAEYVREQREQDEDISDETGLDLFYAKCSVAVSMNPGSRFYMMGYFYRCYRLYEEAARSYRMFLISEEGNLSAMMQLGNCLVDSGNLDEGLEYYEKVIAVNIDFYDIAGRAAFYYKKLYDEVGIRKYIYRAAELAKHAVEGEEDNAFDMLTYAKCLCDIGEYEEAAERLKLLFDIDKMRIEARRICGQCLRALGRFDEAVEVLREGIGLLEPGEDDNYLYGELIRTYQRAYGFEEVESAFMEAKERGEYYYSMAADYGRALEKAGRYEDAMEFFKKDLSMEEGSAFSEKYCIERIIDMEHFITVRDKGDMKALEKHMLDVYEESKTKSGNLNMQEMITEDLAYYYAYEEMDYDKAIDYMNICLNITFEESVRKVENYYWTGKTKECEIQNKYMYELGKLMFIARINHYAGNEENVSHALDTFINAVTLMYGGENEDETMERFGKVATWGLSNSTMIVEYYVYKNDKERAKKWFDIMTSCKMCGECYHKGNDCVDKYDYIAMYYEYIGDIENAKKYYEISFRTYPSIERAYYKLKQMNEDL